MFVCHAQVIVEFAQGIRNSDWIGRQDPYVVLSIGRMTFRTNTCRSGGTSPVWHQSLQFPVGNENDLHVRVLDDDIGRDAVLGTGFLSLSGVRSSPGQRLSVQVPLRAPNNQPMGFVQLGLQFQVTAVGVPSQMVISNTVTPGYPSSSSVTIALSGYVTGPPPPVPPPWGPTAYHPAPVYYPPPQMVPQATTTHVIVANPSPPVYNQGSAIVGGMLLGAALAGSHHGHHRPHHHRRHHRW